MIAPAFASKGLQKLNISAALPPLCWGIFFERLGARIY
jgi:hypothetical protein